MSGKMDDTTGLYLNLMKDALIGVPNRWSPFYQWIRSFRTLTGTWGLDVEVPFSNLELKNLAKRAGFKKYAVLGSESLTKDFLVYSRGFVSALVDLLPRRIQESARRWKAGAANLSDTSTPPNAKEHALRRCREALALAQRETSAPSNSYLANWFSAGLILVGYR